VKLTACEMSMNVMEIKKEDLIDGVQIGGVASFHRRRLGVQVLAVYLIGFSLL